jgi:hypothetical protein
LGDQIGQGIGKDQHDQEAAQEKVLDQLEGFYTVGVTLDGFNAKLLRFLHPLF